MDDIFGAPAPSMQVPNAGSIQGRDSSYPLNVNVQEPNAHVPNGSELSVVEVPDVGAPSSRRS